MKILNYIKPIFHGILKPKYIFIKDLYYGEGEIGSQARRFLDLYFLQDGKTHPLIVFIHGGGWAAGDKSAYADKAKKYMLAGFNVIAINYTYASEDQSTQWPAQLKDVLRAMSFIKRLITIKDDNLIVAGDSAGAHLALFFMDSEIRPRSIINMFGPCDLRTEHMRKIVSDLWILGKLNYEDAREYFSTASPITLVESFINRYISPVITVHGLKDDIVEYEQAIILKSKLDSLGVTNKLITHNGGHDMYNTVPGWKRWWIDLKVLWWTLDRLK